MKRILIVGAHSDDPIIGAGGTARELAKIGNHVAVVSVCGDRIAGYEEAIRLLGAEPIHFDFSYGDIPDEKLSQLLREFFNNFKPDIIFTHWGNEILYDHGVVSQNVLKVARLYEKEVFFFEIPASSLEFTFDVAVDISESFDFKKRAIEVMKEAFDERVFREEVYPSIVYPSGFRGIQVGCKFAEVFKHAGSRFPLSPFRRRLLKLEDL